MKVIGNVEGKFNEEGYAENVAYLGGCIVMLTQREMGILRMLQSASQGEAWSYSFAMDELSKPKDAEMDEIFLLVWQFAKAKFAVNQFKEAINELDTTLMKLEQTPDEL